VLHFKQCSSCFLGRFLIWWKFLFIFVKRIWKNEMLSVVVNNMPFPTAEFVGEWDDNQSLVLPITLCFTIPELVEDVMKEGLERAKRSGRERENRERHKVLTYIEYRAVSGVFRTIDPPPTLYPASVSSPCTKGGGYTLADRWGGGGQYLGRRQTLDWPLTV